MVERMPERPPRSSRPGEADEDTELVEPAVGRSRELASDEDLPVVARLVVEIRSDGRRTVARGAIEDVASGQRTAVVARGESPLRLALDLARAIAQMPRVAARGVVRGLLGRRSGGR